MRALVSTLSWLLAVCILLAAAPADAARKKGKKAGPDEGKGTLPKEKIIKVLKQNKDAIKQCYTLQQEMRPDLEGSVTVRWKIYPEGEVRGVEVVEATLGDKDVQACLKGEIASWTFPKPKGGVATVTFPFTFRPPPPKPVEEDKAAEAPTDEAKPDDTKPADKKANGKKADKKKKAGDDDKAEDKKDKGGDDGMNFGDSDLDNLFGAEKPAEKKSR